MLLDLRAMTDAGTADYSIGTADFWADDQLQTVLDRHRIDIYRDPLEPIPDHTGAATLAYKTYRSRWANLESTSGGSQIFIVEDSIGTDKGTADYSVDYRRGIVTFGTDQRGTVYYLTGRSFDLNGAAADVWRMKGANAAKKFAFSTDGHNLQRNQILDHCMRVANYYESMSRVEVVSIKRSDLT